MTGFEMGQRAFAAALRDPALSPPRFVLAPDPRALLRRFNVYRNSVYAGLVGVLEARYPAVQRLVGDEFFRAMARIFVDAMPPTSPVLLEYGAGFPQFLADFDAVADEPYLPDVARLEWTTHRARHAADAAPLGASAIAAAAQGDASALKLRFAPSVTVLTSAYPVFSLWRANVAPPAEPGPAEFSGAECVLVTRPSLAAEAVRIPRGVAVLVMALLDGETLGAAAAQALMVDANVALDRALALLVAQRAITSLVTLHADLQETPS